MVAVKPHGKEAATGPKALAYDLLRKAKYLAGSAPGGSTIITAQANAFMSILDLVKATVVCGGGSFLIYSFPVIGQIVVIGMLSLLWLLYARKAAEHLRRRRAA